MQTPCDRVVTTVSGLRLSVDLDATTLFQRMNTDEIEIPARGHVPRPGTHLAADATPPPADGTVTTMIRTGTVRVDLTGMKETDPSGVWTITLLRGTGMTTHDDGGMMESEMKG